MKLLLFCLLFIPTTALADNYNPFKKVSAVNNQVIVTFKNSGVRFNVQYNGNQLVSEYGQELKFKVGESFVLTERHNKYIISVASETALKVNAFHLWQGKVTENVYEIKIK